MHGQRSDQAQRAANIPEYGSDNVVGKARSVTFKVIFQEGQY